MRDVAEMQTWACGAVSREKEREGEKEGRGVDHVTCLIEMLIYLVLDEWKRGAEKGEQRTNKYNLILSQFF